MVMMGSVCHFLGAQGKGLIVGDLNESEPLMHRRIGQVDVTFASVFCVVRKSVEAIVIIVVFLDVLDPVHIGFCHQIDPGDWILFIC